MAALAAALLLTACIGQPYDVEAVATEISATVAAARSTAGGTEAPTAAAPAAAEETPPAATEIPPAAAPEAAELPVFDALPLANVRGDLFATSGTCAVCHANLVDQAGSDVSNDALWRSTMMGNAARDPYWIASVRKEIIDTPGLSEVIQDKCATCHMPMARTTAASTGEPPLVLDVGFANADHPLHTLAMDGVSCTLCHQIEPEAFGERASFDGHYVINTELPAGERINYGPFDPPPGQAAVMQGASGFIPVQSLHIQQSEMCATCHTLYTPYVDAAGEVVGEFPEQMPYIEWLASDYADKQSCQACHMPEAAGGVQLSVTGGPLRSPFRQHFFVGGNSYGLAMLRQFGPELGATASSAHFDATIARMEDMMASQVATLAVENAALSDGTLAFDVAITNLVGHKFPSAYPSRRAWLHITVTDSTGAVIFESGAFNPDGSIVGNANDEDPAAFEPHYTTLTAADQVQIYEPIMVNTDGEVTTTLLRGAAYIKDNRLLPAGFDKAEALPEIGVYGDALADEDFTAGGDHLRVEVDAAGASGPLTISVELLYQSIGFRWADNLRAYAAPEPATFIGIYEQVPNLPVTVAAASGEASP
jgi:hypothetical protein